MVSSNFFVASLIIEMTIGTFNFHTSWLISLELEPCKIAEPNFSSSSVTGKYMLQYWRHKMMIPQDPYRLLNTRTGGHSVECVSQNGGFGAKKDEGGHWRWWPGLRSRLESCYVPVWVRVVSVSPLSLVSCQSCAPLCPRSYLHHCQAQVQVQVKGQEVLQGV